VIRRTAPVKTSRERFASLPERCCKRGACPYRRQRCGARRSDHEPDTTPARFDSMNDVRAMCGNLPEMGLAKGDNLIEEAVSTDRLYVSGAFEVVRNGVRVVLILEPGAWPRYPRCWDRRRWRVWWPHRTARFTSWTKRPPSCRNVPNSRTRSTGRVRPFPVFRGARKNLPEPDVRAVAHRRTTPTRSVALGRKLATG